MFPLPLMPPWLCVLIGAVAPFAVSVAKLDCPPLLTEVEAVPCVLIALPPLPTATATTAPGVRVKD
jgi:hypothetical protein